MKPLPHSRAGFTLVEVLIAGFFLTSLLMVAGLATDRTLSSFRARRAEQETVVAANRLLERIARELAFAARAGLGPATLGGVGAERVEYRVATGGGAFGPARTIALELDTGEIDNGKDDDGDSLVDEQRVLWIEDEGGPAERRIVLATELSEYLDGELPNGVDDNGNDLRDERGLSFVLDGDTLVVRVTQLYTLPGGIVRARTLETSLFPRN